MTTTFHHIMNCILYIKNHISYHFLYIFLLNICFFILMAYILPIQYEVNDDYWMCMIANGIYSGNPDEHLVFINVIIGYILKFLYSKFNIIEWYTLFLSFVQIISFTTILYVVCTNIKKNGNFIRWLFFLFVYLFWCKLICYFQFTTIAGVSCLSGCLVFLSKKKKEAKFLGCILIIVSFLIRYQATCLIILLLFPIAMSKDGLRLIKSNVVSICGIALICLCSTIINNLSYSSPDWSLYFEYNKIRGG